MDDWNSFLRSITDGEALTGVSPANALSFLITLLVALCFGLILSTLYNLYFQDNEPQDGSLSRSLVLLTPALTSIFWMIQFSVPISIGLIGALSFVRFRTPVKRSEDVTFIVIALGVAIACATGHFIIAFTLVSVFLVFAFIRSRLHWLGIGSKRFGIITYNTSKTSSLIEIQKLIEPVLGRYEIVSTRTYDGITSYVINVPDLNDKKYEAVNQALAGYDVKSHVSIFYPSDRLGS